MNLKGSCQANFASFVKALQRILQNASACPLSTNTPQLTCAFPIDCRVCYDSWHSGNASAFGRLLCTLPLRSLCSALPLRKNTRTHAHAHTHTQRGAHDLMRMVGVELIFVRIHAHTHTHTRKLMAKSPRNFPELAQFFDA